MSWAPALGVSQSEAMAREWRIPDMPIQPSSLQLIDALLAIPAERPEALEAGSVECLRDELVAIRCVLIEEQVELQDAEVRRVSSYLSELHQRMLDIAENMVEVLSTAPTR